MRILGINQAFNTRNNFNCKKAQTNPLLQNTFVFNNQTDTVSFSRKKTKEKTDKKQIYKQFRKAGCGEKDTNSVFNNEKKYKNLLALMSASQNFERELTPKEMIALTVNDFDEEQINRFIRITGNTLALTRTLTQKEATSIIKNNVSDSQIQRFIDLKATNEEGKSLLSRPLTNSEACLVCNENFDNVQAETFLRFNNINFYFHSMEFLRDREKVQRFIDLTSENNGETLLSRKLTDEEAVKITLWNFNNEQSQRFIDLVENKNQNSRILDSDEAKAIIKAGLDNSQIEEFIKRKKFLEERSNKRNSSRNLKNDSITLTVKKGFDTQRTSIFHELANRFWEENARLLVEDDEKYTKLLSLISNGQKRPLKLDDAGLVLQNNFNDVQIEIYKDLINAELRSYDAINFIKDDENTKKYLSYTNPDTTAFSRKLDPNEAIVSITKNFSKKQIEELIRLKDNNPDLKLDYITTLLNFIDFKDKTDIHKLKTKEKRNLLKLLVKHNADLFNDKISSTTYPLVPKNAKEYCTILPKLATAIGLNTNPLTDEEATQFFNELNKLTTSQNKELKVHFDFICEKIPELKAINKANTLAILERIVENPKFEQLEKEDKNILVMALLLKGISTDSEEAAFDAFYILQRFNLSEDEQLKIYELIKTSNWFEKLSTSNNEEIEKLAQDIAFKTRHSNTFELSKILCEAEIKQDKSSMKTIANIIDSYLKELQQTQIFLPQTKIPKASQMKNCETLSFDGVTNTVLYINKTDKPLSEYGFESGTTLDNWQGLAHGLDTEEQLQIFNTFSLVDSDALLSSSYMNPAKYKVFRKQGVILDVNPNDIHAGYYKDFGSGFKKNIETIKREYLFKESNNTNLRRDKRIYRTYIPNLIKKHMGYSDDDYLKVIKDIQGCKAITDIEKKNKQFAQSLLEIFSSEKFGERKHDRQYNEFLVSRPKIQGVFSYGQSYENIPLFLRKYAQDNDLPIIIFG